jgi:hypothetical protein
MRRTVVLAAGLLCGIALGAAPAFAADETFSKAELDQPLAPVALYPDSLRSQILEDEEPSPLGPMFGEVLPGLGYHGYHFRVLRGQGPHAPGGAYDYVWSGSMIGGFGVVAWPAEYRETGVMTFISSHDGLVYESDLGADGDALARATGRFDPGPGWSRVEPPETPEE